MKKTVSSILLLSSLMINLSCEQGSSGGGGSSSKSSKSPQGKGSFSIATAPSLTIDSCFDHKADTLDDGDCGFIGGTHNSTDISSCKGVSGTFNNCEYGTPQTSCQIGSVQLAMQESFDSDLIESCQLHGGQIVTKCVGISEGDCTTAGGSWETDTINSCINYDVQTAENCNVAMGNFRPNARIMIGDLSAGPESEIINGNNQIYIDVTDDGSDPVITEFSSTYQIIWTEGSVIHWSGPITFTPTSKFYGDDFGQIFFNMNSPIKTNSLGIDTDGDGSVETYTSMDTSVLVVD